MEELEILVINRNGNLKFVTVHPAAPSTLGERRGAFTFFPLRIARIVLRSSPVSLVVFRNPRALISAIRLLLAATRPPSK